MGTPVAGWQGLCTSPSALICRAEEISNGRERQFSDRPDPIWDDRGLPGAAAAQHPGPPDGIRASGAAIPAATWRTSGATGNRRPSGGAPGDNPDAARAVEPGRPGAGT